MAQASICLPLVLMFFLQSDVLLCKKIDITLPKPNISSECKSAGICDSVENYPIQLVKGLIDKLESQNTIFDYDEAPIPKINMRINEEEPSSLCGTKSRFVPPKAAKDMNGDWQFIINDSKKPVQVFRIEICRTPMGRCSEDISFISGYDGACIQKMVFREMFYVNETNEIDKTYFEVPTCCSCVLLRKDDVN